MGAPPWFGPEGGRWTLGSNVRAHTWTLNPKTGEVCEVSIDAVVAGIQKGGPEGWIVRVSFGPLLDAALRNELAPSQIVAV